MSGSLWKKDISLRRKAADVAPAAEATQTEPVVAAGPVEPAAPVAPLPPAVGDYGWLTANFDPNDVPENMPTVTAPVAAPPLLVEPTPTPVPAVSPPAVSLPAVSAPPASEPTPERLVQVAQAAAAAGAEPKVPFWKKELGKPKGPKVAKAAKPAKAEQPAGEKVPYWKKELGKPKGPKVAKAAKPAKAEQPAGEKIPFWKKELGKPKGPKVAKAAKPAKAEQTAGEKVPFWKKELGKPKADKGAAVAKPAKGAKGAKAEKQPKVKGGRKPRPVKIKNGSLVGLKIGASQIAAARVSNNGVPQLLQVARAELAEGIVVGGELRDVDALAATLKEMFSAHKLPKDGVRLGIANNRIGVRTFEITGIDDPGQLANAIRFRAQETLPIPLEEAVLDWQVLEESVNEETGQLVRRVLLVVAYRELVESYVLACRKAGIKLAGIDLEAFAMLRALTAPLTEEEMKGNGAQVVVNVGHDRSTFAVSDGRVCEFTRVLGWGGQSLTLAIARALEVSPVEATPVKHALSLVATQIAPPDGVTAESLDVAREAAKRELQSFARELVSSLRFYQNQPGSLGIGELVLTGGTAHLPGFAEELNRLIGVPVRVGDPLNRVVIPKKFSEPDYSLGSLTVAIGLGIED